MLFALISIPLSLLCAYLAFACFRKRQLRIALTLTLCCAFFLLVAAIGIGTTWYIWDVFPS